MTRAGATFLTGASGFTGRHLAARLRAAGHHVVGVDRAPPLLPGDVQADLLASGVMRDLIARVRPVRVYHLAGPVAEPRDEAGRKSALDATVSMTLGLLEALAGLGGRRRMLVTSSCATYGAPSRADGRTTEQDPVAPVSFYGLSKAMQELVALSFGRQSGVEVVVTRGYNLLGPGEGDRSVTGTVLAQLAAGSRRIRTGSVDTARDFLDVRDAAAAYEAVMEQGEAFAVYNVGSGRAVAVNDVIGQVLAQWGGGCVLERDESRLRRADVPCVFADNSRLLGLGWRPAHALADSVRDAVAAQREGRDQKSAVVGAERR
ncbi:MAG: NAD(P)-dependent oxidoreductase [Deltaproteobacteria bacterium]|nr:NAD(P)-dependent oxidoreductase [Deltaproteobacteria bacterium]